MKSNAISKNLGDKPIMRMDFMYITLIVTMCTFILLTFFLHQNQFFHVEIIYFGYNDAKWKTNMPLIYKNARMYKKKKTLTPLTLQDTSQFKQ